MDIPAKVKVNPFKKIFERIKKNWEDLDNNPEWLVPREGWGAKPPFPAEGMFDEQPLDYPVSYVVIHDTSNYDDPGRDTEKIKEVLREIQEDDMAEDLKQSNDICYNFMVGGDGKVYEGRGWTMVGEHTYHCNEDSIGVALIGDHRGKPPTGDMLLASRKLIEEGVRKHYLKADVKVVPHSHMRRGVRCPTKHLEKAVERGILSPPRSEGEWAWLWTVKRWLNEFPQKVRDHVKGQIDYWIDEWKWCSTRQFINYYWNN